ncbi:MAG TPA: hypothetical protein VGK24_18790 [Candidatus Angelobacter sp.]
MKLAALTATFLPTAQALPYIQALPQYISQCQSRLNLLFTSLKLLHRQIEGDALARSNVEALSDLFLHFSELHGFPEADLNLELVVGVVHSDFLADVISL